MNLHLRKLLLVLTLLALGAPKLAAQSAVVWTGPLITYNQPAPDPTQPANQDRITPDVWLTRASSKGLFNAFNETGAGFESPTNTEWAFGDLTNYSSLSYSNWLDWLNGASPVTLVGQPAVLHLISDNIYIAIEFTFWGQHASGGFTYQRSTPPPPPVYVTNLTPAVTGGSFSLSYAATPGQTYIVQTSSDFGAWVPAQTNLASSNLVTFTEGIGANLQRFYRVQQVAAP
ncbi:MAG TPA: hypothetical protein VHB20_02260 [Verrucomicrobiae bacterium]|jgi:hypothetical protein|nr:hypothetical protein [Verrucomicrobiae bacterium]